VTLRLARARRAEPSNPALRIRCASVCAGWGEVWGGGGMGRRQDRKKLQQQHRQRRQRRLPATSGHRSSKGTCCLSQPSCAATSGRKVAVRRQLLWGHTNSMIKPDRRRNVREGGGRRGISEI
jgi:hypothetical protein